MSTPDQQDQWHLSPRVTLTVLGWLITASLGGLAWAFSVSAEMAVHKALIAAIRDENTRQDLANTEASRLVRDELREMRVEMRALREALQQRNKQP